MDTAMASYDFNYTILILRQAIDLAEIEHDFAPLRKWVNEVDVSGNEMGAIETRLNQPTGQDFLMTILQSVADRSVSPEEAFRQIRFWLNNGAIQNAAFSQQYQFA